MLLPWERVTVFNMRSDDMGMAAFLRRSMTTKLKGLCDVLSGPAAGSFDEGSRRWPAQTDACFFPGSARIERLDEFAAVIANSAHQFGDRPEEHRWVIKANFGMAARERLLGHGRQMSESHLGWIQRRLVADGCVFFEPWLPIRAEVGLQFTVPPRGDGLPRPDGITPLLTDASGGYRGSHFSLDVSVPREWQSAVEDAHRAATRLQELGYFGPLGIDAAQHELPRGEVVVRPLQDINARFTMGRLALGFRRLLRDKESGLWQHFGTNESAVTGCSQTEPNRVIPTSPPFVGGQPTQHRSSVVITTR